MARTVILMAYRGDGEGYGGSGWRDRAFTYVYDYLTSFTDDIWVHDSGDHPFSIGKSYNQAAAKAGDWDKAVIHPPDIWIPWESLERGAAAADDGLIHPYDFIRKMDEDQTARFFEGEREEPYRRYKAAFPPMICPRWLWDTFGGFDEGMVGHGSEDSVFTHCADVFGRKPRSRTPGPMYVLWHPKHKQDPDHPEESEFYAHKAENRAILEAYWKHKTPESLRAFMEEHR